MASLKGLFKRNKKAQDPFGGDDDEDFYEEDVFDDDSDESGLGRKIAFGLSGVMGLLLIGFIVTAVMTADESAGPVTGSIPTEIAQVVSEDGEVLETLIPMEALDPAASGSTARGTTVPGSTAADGPIALPPITDGSEIVGDSTVETDRSASRRPWLAGNDDTTEPQDSRAGRQTGSMADLLRRTQEGEPGPNQAASSQAALPPSARQAEVLEPATPELTAEGPTEDTQLAALPSPADPATPDPMANPESAPEPEALAIAKPGLLPGAPRRFTADTVAEGGTQGNPPRLVEPVTPPTDSRSISAAPPHFSTLPDAEELVQDPNARARVAIIVEGLGLNREATEAAIKSLPASVTLAFSPYTRDLQDWLRRATEAGHEVLVEVPLESNRFPADDPGPLGLLTSLDQIQNVERLTAILNEADGSAGILDNSGSRFRESTSHINLLMNNLDARNLFYVQGRPGLRLGNDRVPTATADIVLDERAFRASIDARLDYIEQLAKYKGNSVAVASAKPVTFERITLWLDNVGQRGIALAPVSQVLIR
ncbi:MAG: divergent polysaccharide deacetylase family protein [Rhodospirillaceae bacterium]